MNVKLKHFVTRFEMLSTRSLLRVQGLEGGVVVSNSSSPTAEHSLFVVVTVALVTHASRVLPAAFHNHFLSGAGTAH